MIFGAIWSSGLREIARVDGNKNSSSHIDILKSHILPLMQNDQVLQQDNAPCHKSNEVKNFMEKFGVAVVPDWPPIGHQTSTLLKTAGEFLNNAWSGINVQHWMICGKKLRRNFMKPWTVLFKNCLSLLQDE